MAQFWQFARTSIISILWLLPFVAFLSGYQLLRFYTHTETITVPSVIGLHMSDAIKLLSADRLNVRILAEKEDPDLHEGIILSQTPAQGKVVKPHQSIFLVITRKPPKPRAPALFGISQADAVAKAQELGFRLKFYEIESIHPEGTGIAQSILPGQELADKTMSAYISAGSTSLRIFPDLKGKKLEDIFAFFKPYNIKVEVVPEGQKGVVIDQRPLPGSLVDLKKTPVVTVTLENEQRI